LSAGGCDGTRKEPEMTSVQIRERVANVKEELYFLSQGGLTSVGQFDPRRVASLGKEKEILEQQLAAALQQEQLAARVAAMNPPPVSSDDITARHYDEEHFGWPWSAN
jgi:hypothetical protein